MEKRICKICGKEFLGKKNQRFCSGTCRLEDQKIYARSRARLDKTKEYHRMYAKRYGG